MSRERRRLGVAIAALALTQVWHGLDIFRVSEDVSLAEVFLDPLGLLGLGGTVLALLAVVLPLRRGPFVGGLVGALTAVGFVLYHVVPVETGLNNPYWGEADAIQWLAVAVTIVVGAACVPLSRAAAGSTAPPRSAEAAMVRTPGA